MSNNLPKLQRGLGYNFQTVKDLSIFDSPHRRFNPLTREWVLVSPQRAARPWSGQVEKVPPEQLPRYDPSCYLCPGNERAGGVKNPNYQGTYVFDNDFPALLPGTGDPSQLQADDELMQAEPEPGICRVICFSPRHDLTIPQLSLAEVESVIRTWADQSRELEALDWIQYVQVFENKGAVMGCSNPHPHSQLWATRHIPNEPAKELLSQRDYLQEHGSPLLQDYLTEELNQDRRLIVENEDFAALVPFWAIWPFEVMIIARRRVSRLGDLTRSEQSSLAALYRDITRRYDRLFGISFPYSMGFHQAPADGSSHPEWALHAHFYPPLLRSASVKKFMVGYELLAMPQRDLTAETAALRLRELGE